MSDIIRSLRRSGEEQEQRQLQRAISRLIRSSRSESPVRPAAFPPTPQPQFPGGIVPVLVLNPPVNLRR
jgi:hypothetical protein